MSVYRSTGVWIGLAGLVLAQFALSQSACSDPEWLTSTIYSEYAQADRVPLPWSPVTVGENSVYVWGRSFEWSSASILPSSIKTQGKELLKAPLRLVARISGNDYTVPLGSLSVTDQKNKRVTMTASGSIQGLNVSADMFVDYDGFLWVKLTVDDPTPGRQIGSLRVVADLDAALMKFYQTFDNDLYGRIGVNPIQFSWVVGTSSIVNFYHWFGNQDLGIGFTYTTLKNWKPTTRSNFATLTPGAPSTSYRLNLIESSTDMNGQVYEFGVQATPIKPLPPDYHSWMTTRIASQPYKVWNRIPENIDLAVTYASSLMPGLNAPYKVSSGYQAYVDWAHQKGVAVATLAACPQRFSEQSDEWPAYNSIWKALPETYLPWGNPNVNQYMNCGKPETLRKWNFFGWAVKNADRFGTDGVFYDGWMAGQMGCNNAAHDHGWVDGQGVRQLEVPALEGREYNHVMALYLQDHVPDTYARPETAPARPGFPQYYYYIHSWSFVPSVMGHASLWLTGEQAGYKNGGTFSGKTLGEVWGLEGLYCKSLSTNFGVVNTFYPCIWEAGDPADPETTDWQTLAMYAWFLPHGVPIGIMDYMNADRVVEIANVMMDFEARKAQFTPAWRANPYIQIVSPTSEYYVVGTWAHPEKRKVLAAVSNLTTSEARDVVLQWTGFPNPRVKNALTAEEIPVVDGEITVNLNPESFVLLQIESGDAGTLPGAKGFLVAWRNSYKVVLYDANWGFVRNFVVFPDDGYGNRPMPTAVAQDKQTGDVYVAVTTDVVGSTTGGVLKFDNAGNQIPGWSVSGIGYVTGLAVRDDGKVFVSDQTNQTLKWYSTSNSSVSGQLSSGSDPMGPVADMDIDSQGRLIVAAGPTVKRWNANLTYDRILINTANAVDVKIMPSTGNLRVLRWDGYLLGYDSEGNWTGPYYSTGTPPFAQALWLDPAGGEQSYYRAATSTSLPYGGIQRGMFYGEGWYWDTIVNEGGGNWYPRDIEPYVFKGKNLDVTVTLQDYLGDVSLLVLRVEVWQDGMLVASKTVAPTGQSTLVNFGVQPGQYTVRASATQWLTKQTSVEVVGDTQIGLSLPNGDVFGNNSVDSLDYLILKGNFDEAGD